MRVIREWRKQKKDLGLGKMREVVSQVSANHLHWSPQSQRNFLMSMGGPCSWSAGPAVKWWFHSSSGRLLQPVFRDCGSQGGMCSQCSWRHVHNIPLASDNHLRQRSTACVWGVQIVHEHKQHPTHLHNTVVATSEWRGWTPKLHTLKGNQDCPCSRPRLEKEIKNFSPCIQKHLLFKRKIRTKLPELDSGIKTEIDKTVGDRDRAQKERGKLYTDRKRNAKETEVAVGDEVLLQQKRQDKLTSFYEPEPYKVVEKNGSQVLI